MYVCVCVGGGVPPLPGWVCVEGISGMNLVQVYSWASSYPPYKCILEYGKSIPIDVLFPFRLKSFMQKTINTVKYLNIN